jgi:hypothetical protein
LLSSGAVDSGGDMFVDNDLTGESVFFTSLDKLAPSDTDGLGDMYVARVGGGQSPDDDSRPTCQGDACQQPPSAPPALAPPVAPASGPSAGEAKPVARLRVRRTRTSRTAITVLVRTPAAGVIRVGGRRVRAVKRRAAEAGTREVKVRLVRGARRALRKRDSVRVPLQIQFRSTEGVSLSEQLTVKVKIKRSKRADRKAR